MPTGDHASCDHTATTPWTAEASEPPDGRPAYLTDHGAAAQEIGRLRWALNQVIALADDAPVLTDEQLRDRLLALANQARPRGQ